MNNKENPRQRYIGQLHTALETYPELVDEYVSLRAERERDEVEFRLRGRDNE
jgi:hypothetical protein